MQMHSGVVMDTNFMYLYTNKKENIMNCRKNILEYMQEQIMYNGY